MEIVSAIVPCYNEEKNVKLFFERINEAFAELNYGLEIVFINDGSKDNTLSELKKLVDTDKCSIKVVTFSRNFGKEAAMYAGFNTCTGDYAVVIDADLQQDPFLIKDMLKVLEDDEDCDCVAFFQQARKEPALLRFFKKSFYGIINKMSDVEFVNGASDFRIFRRCVVESILSISEKNRFSKGIFSWVGFNTHYLPYVANERMYGESKWNFFKLFKYALSGIISFSTVPLKVATWLGTIFSMCSIVYFIVVFCQRLFVETPIPGYATMVCLILLIGGIQLFCLGIIGEYLARTYVESKNRPVYIIKKIYSND